MIQTLHIKNVGIINEININLNEGFNIFTGETGAGKSLIIGSLKMLSGGRFSKEIIRSGENHSFIEAQIIFENEEYIVSREVNISGRNICKINGRLVSVNELKEFMKKVIDIHGQQDNQTILEQSSHIKFLDDYAKNEIEEIKNNYQKEYNEYLKIKEELKKNYGDDKEKQRKLDLLYYQYNEIEDAKLEENEEEKLEERERIILNSEKIITNLEAAHFSLNENVLNELGTVLKNIEKISNFNNEYGKILENIQTAYYELEEAERDLYNNKENVSFDEEERNEVEERLNLIQNLKRKYGNNIEEILNYQLEVKKQIDEIENLSDYISNLKKEKKEITQKMQLIADQMNKIRVIKASEMEEKINAELEDLEMKNAKFKVLIEKQEDFNLNGKDFVEFLICTNIGEEFKPLVKIASGGEMSRIMLGIKKVLSDIDKVPVLIFDEIDTGISGLAANKVGIKMKEISQCHQVLCITHLAQIAAKGNYNYFIHKEVENEKTITKIEELNEEEIIKELARIATGEITNISIEHAKELRGSKVA